jgi:hypothetical protein
MENNYNGFTNKATYLLSQWVNNQEYSYNLWTTRAKSLTTDELTEDLKEYFEDEIYPLTGTTPYTDLLDLALDLVNWREIAIKLKEGNERTDLDDKS